MWQGLNALTKQPKVDFVDQKAEFQRICSHQKKRSALLSGNMSDAFLTWVYFLTVFNARKVVKVE